MVEERAVGADRVLLVLSELGKHPAGIALEELAAALASPKSSVHRALSTLRKRGFAAKDHRGNYVVGDELLRLAFSVHEQRPEHARIEPVLARLSERFGETVHYAVLDGSEVVYRAKVDSPAAGIRLTSVVGGRNPAHATGVGKVLLADRFRDFDGFVAWANTQTLDARTDSTLTDAASLWADFERIRELGYALDREESERGVACIAFPVSLSATGSIDGAVSVSAIAVRTPLEVLIAHAAEIRAELGGLAISR